MAALLILLGGSYGGISGVACPGCLQKEHSILCMICNSLVDFLHISHELYALKESVQTRVDANCMEFWQIIWFCWGGHFGKKV